MIKLIQKKEPPYKHMDYGRDYCPNCNTNVSTVYTVVFDGEKEVHAVVANYKSMNSLQLDRMFGGGLSVICGRPAKGKAIISPFLRHISHVTCKDCKKLYKKKE